MRSLIQRLVFRLILFAPYLALCSCETVPSVQSVQAVKTQNQVTRQHIQKAQTHIEAAEKAQKEEQDHVQAAIDDLNTLLRATPTPAPKSRHKKR